MKSIFTELSKKIYGVHKINFEQFNITDYVNNNNLQILKAGSLMMSLMFLVMFILSFILENYESNRYFYFFEMLSTVTIYVCSRFLFPRKPVLILPAVYFFAAGLYYYGMHIGIVTSPEDPAVTLCLVLAIIPLLFIDGAVRMILFSTLAALVSFILVFNIKTPSTIIIDFTDIFFSWITGIALAVEVNRIRINSYARECEVIYERDTDGLTGLSNKNAVVRKISDAISEEGAKGAFFIMDIDKFKRINDSFGHSYGDEVLVKTARCIEKVFDNDGITGRFGGDEFIFYVKNTDKTAAAMIAEKLLLTLYTDVKLQDKTGLHGSIGIAVYKYASDMNYDSLMKIADKALYVTKKEGRFGYTVYSDEKMEKQNINIT